MLAMQRELQDRYKDKWEPISPEEGKHDLLWMIGEIGEVIDIIKKMAVKMLFPITLCRKNWSKNLQMF